MDLDELRAFLVLKDTGSFLAAADALSLSRTTLRRRIDALEARVGVPLLYRGAQGATLTDAGLALAARGPQVLQEATSLLVAVREVGAEPAGTLRVVLPVGLPPHGMIPIFVAMRLAFPRLNLETRFCDDLPLSATDDADIAILFGAQVPEGPWTTRVITRIRVHLVGSHEYLASHGTPATPDDLKDHELLAWRRPGADPRLWPNASGAPFAVNPVMISADAHSLRQLAIAGHGLALLPDAMLPDPGVKPEVLVPVLPEVIREECPLRILVPEGRSQAPKIRGLMERMEAFFEQV